MSILPIKLKTNNFILTVEFSDGKVKQIDARTFLRKDKKTDEIKKSLSMFKTAFIEDGMAITWENGFSLDSDVVYEEGEDIQSFQAVSMVQKVAKHYKK